MQRGACDDTPVALLCEKLYIAQWLYFMRSLCNQIRVERQV